jgi:hypothetical protein
MRIIELCRRVNVARCLGRSMATFKACGAEFMTEGMLGDGVDLHLSPVHFTWSIPSEFSHPPLNVCVKPRTAGDKLLRIVELFIGRLRSYQLLHFVTNRRTLGRDIDQTASIGLMDEPFHVAPIWMVEVCWLFDS